MQQKPDNKKMTDKEAWDMIGDALVEYYEEQDRQEDDSAIFMLKFFACAFLGYFVLKHIIVPILWS